MCWRALVSDIWGLSQICGRALFRILRSTQGSWCWADFYQAKGTPRSDFEQARISVLGTT
jgi:hypothetical protein